jgi:hypothetical protein
MLRKRTARFRLEVHFTRLGGQAHTCLLPTPAYLNRLDPVTA